MRVMQTYHTTRLRQPIRLIATDLDGTLLRPDGTISSGTYTILQEIQKAGIIVVLVSARPPRVLHKIARASGIIGLAICCNGAIIYDLDQEIIIQHAPLMPELAARLIQTLREKIPNLCFACECGLEFKCEPDFYSLNPVKEQISPHIADALTFCNEPITKLIMLHATYSAEELSALTTQIIGEQVTVTHSGSPFLEISAVGVHKAWALTALCEKLEITADEVVAFGDMPNDLSMLRWAGHGVAMANAHPLVKEEANEVTLSNAEDGVARVLERILLHI